MKRTPIRTGLAIALLQAPLLLLAAACSSSPDEQRYLTQFFRAARARDNNTIAMMSAVEFDPREQGEVSSFEITNVTEERRTPLEFKSTIEAERKAIADENEFKKRKVEYQNANLAALETVVKLERDPKAKMTPEQQKIKAEWDKWRADTNMFQKSTAAAKAAVMQQTGIAEASLTQPGQPTFNAEKFEGELLTKDVTLNAQVKMPDGQTVPKTLVVTIQRVVGKLDGAERQGRSIITRIQGA
jgi:hypothetical protein